MLYGTNGSTFDDYYIVKSTVKIDVFQDRAKELGQDLEFKSNTIKTITPNKILIPDTDVSLSFLINSYFIKEFVFIEC